MIVNRALIITGASRGFGRAVLERLLREGADAVICARDERELFDARDRAQALTGRRVVAVPADVSVESEARAVVDACAREFGRVDVLINNAGAHGYVGPFEGADFSAWRRATEVNLFGAAYMIHAALPHMRAQGKGKIINISGGGATSARANFSAYAAAKTALVRLTETLAAELRGTGIDINAVAPGAMNTRLTDEIIAAGAAAGAECEKAERQKREGGTPLEVGAGLCAYLAGEESDGISGRLISAQWDDWRALGINRELIENSDIFTLRRILPEDRGATWKFGQIPTILEM